MTRVGSNFLMHISAFAVVVAETLKNCHAPFLKADDFNCFQKQNVLHLIKKPGCIHPSELERRK
jgi:hypothetical protein